MDQGGHRHEERDAGLHSGWLASLAPPPHFIHSEIADMFSILSLGGFFAETLGEQWCALISKRCSDPTFLLNP
jgi:hypothetical protein